MSNSAHPERSSDHSGSDRSGSDRSAETEPSWAELLDPAALERRLRDARERRAEAIRARKERADQDPSEDGGNVAPTSPRPTPRAVVVPGDGNDIPSRPGFPARKSPGQDSGPDSSAPQSPDRAGSGQVPPGREFSDRALAGRDGLIRPGSMPPLAGDRERAERPIPPASRGFPAAAALAARKSAETAGSPGADTPRWPRPASAATPRGPLPARAAAARDAEESEARPRPPARSGWVPPRPSPAPERETPAPTKPEARSPETETPSDESPAPAKPIRPVSLEPPVPLFEPGQSQTRAGGMRGFPATLAVLLILLLGGGAAILFAPASFRARLADLIAPATAPGPESSGSQSASDEAAAPGDGTISARPVPAPPRQSASVEDSAVSGDAPDAMADSPGAPWMGVDDQPAASRLSVPRASAPTTFAAADPFGELAAPGAPATIGPLRLPELAPDQHADEPVAALPPPPAVEEAPMEEVAVEDAPGSEIAAIDQLVAAPADPEAATTDSPTEASPTEAPAEPVVDMSDATALASARISVNYPATAAGTANEIAVALRAAGAGAANVVPVGFSVSSTNVRYYHAQDRAAAEALAALAAGAGPVETRDFTSFRPQPLPGVVEIWLRGSGSSGGGSSGGGTATTQDVAPAATARTTTRTPARTPAQPPSARDLEAEEVERMLLSREVERLLRQQGGAP